MAADCAWLIAKNRRISINKACVRCFFNKLIKRASFSKKSLFAARRLRMMSYVDCFLSEFSAQDEELVEIRSICKLALRSIDENQPCFLIYLE